MKKKIIYQDCYLKYSTSYVEKYQLENGADVESLYTQIDELYVPKEKRYQKVEYKLLNRAMKQILDEGDLTIKYFCKEAKEEEYFDYIFSILTDFGFHILSKSDQGVMFGFLTKDEIEE